MASSTSRIMAFRRRRSRRFLPNPSPFSISTSRPRWRLNRIRITAAIGPWAQRRSTEPIKLRGTPRWELYCPYLKHFTVLGAALLSRVTSFCLDTRNSFFDSWVKKLSPGLSAMLPTTTPSSFPQELFDLFRDLDPDSEEAGKPLRGPNQWPSESLVPG